MASKVEVYNKAAMRIGVFDTRIESDTETSKIVQCLNEIYDGVLDYVLMEFPWKFAERRVLLSSLGTPPTNWGYRYSYPSDCVMARYITRPGARSLRSDQQIPFQIGTNGTAREIYSDMPDAELVYTARITDLNQWGAIAVSALAYYLASEIAMPMSVKPDVANSALSGYYREVSRAAAAALNETTPDRPPVSEFLAVRDGMGPIADANPISGGWLP